MNIIGCDIGCTKINPICESINPLLTNRAVYLIDQKFKIIIMHNIIANKRVKKFCNNVSPIRFLKRQLFSSQNWKKEYNKIFLRAEPFININLVSTIKINWKFEDIWKAQFQTFGQRCTIPFKHWIRNNKTEHATDKLVFPFNIQIYHRVSRRPAFGEILSFN